MTIIIKRKDSVYEIVLCCSLSQSHLVRYSRIPL